MTNTTFGADLTAFPISGQAVCEALLHALNPPDVCEIRDIETLSTDGSLELGALWQIVSTGQAARRTVKELITAIMHADQVIAIDLRFVGDRHRELVIEDGELIANSL